MDMRSVKNLAVPMAIVVVGVALLITLFLSITGRLDELRSSNSDNLTWSLTQVEVDVLKLQAAARELRTNPDASLGDLRRRFNNAYSRSENLATSPVFAPMRSAPDFADQITVLRDCFNKLAAIIDSSEENVRENLPEVDALIRTLLKDARDASLTGIKLTSAASDRDRTSLRQLLVAAEVVSALVIILLMSALVFIFRQWRNSRRVSEQAQRANVRLSSTVDVSLDAIVIADLNGTIVDFNEAAEGVFGYTKAQAVGSQMSELIIPKQHREAHAAGMARINRTGERNMVGRGRFEMTALRQSGQEFPVEISIGQAEDDRGAIFIAYLRDITARKDVQKNLEHARDEAVRAEAAKSNFLAVMSHEMRTPLNGIFGAVELLKATPLTEHQANYLDIAQQSGDILLHHVNNVLDVTRMDEGKLELVPHQFEIAQFFRDIVAFNTPTAQLKGNVLVADIADLGRETVLVDRHRLRQILYNLIGNAVKFTENGRITVSATLDSVEEDTAHLVFSVKDTGIGIPLDEQDKVFDRFFTRNGSYDRMAPGAGLGLTICKELVGLMNGTILLDSVPGHGSTFDVCIPVQLGLPETETPSVDMVDAPNTLAGARILLVEDNEINRIIVRQMLKARDLIVTEVNDGAAAVAIAKRTAFDAILMDISMPVMNGVDATKAIRATSTLNAHTPIIALTAHAESAEVDRFMQAGMAQCLTKPMSQSHLMNVLSVQLSAKPLIAPVTPQPAPTTDVLNAETLNDLVASFDQARLEKMVRVFEDEVANLFGFASGFLGPDDFVSLAEMAHKSVGSAGMMGASALHKALRGMEDAASTGSPPGIQAALDNAQNVWPDTLAALQKAIRGYPVHQS